MFRAKRTKQKLYIGYDSTEFIILRVYVSEYDKNKKVKSIEIHSYSMIQKKEIILNKTIKELLGVDSISVNGVKIVMNEIIEKVLQQNDEPINVDNLSEVQKEKNNENNKEEFKIENNEENNEDNTKENIQNDKVHNDSSIEEADYNF